MTPLALAGNLRDTVENKGCDAFHANVTGEPSGIGNQGRRLRGGLLLVTASQKKKQWERKLGPDNAGKQSATITVTVPSHLFFQLKPNMVLAVGLHVEPMGIRVSTDQAGVKEHDHLLIEVKSEQIVLLHEFL